MLNDEVMEEPKKFHIARSLSYTFIQMPFQCVLSGEGTWASRIRAEEWLWSMFQRLKMPRHIAFSIAQTQLIFLETESTAILQPIVGFSPRVGFVYRFPTWLQGGWFFFNCGELEVFAALNLLELPLFSHDYFRRGGSGVRHRRVG